MQVPAAGGREILVDGQPVEGMGELDREAGLARVVTDEARGLEIFECVHRSGDAGDPSDDAERHPLVDHGQGRGEVTGRGGKVADAGGDRRGQRSGSGKISVGSPKFGW